MEPASNSDNLQENNGKREGTRRRRRPSPKRGSEANLSDASPEECRSLSELLPSMYNELRGSPAASWPVSAATTFSGGKPWFTKRNYALPCNGPSCVSSSAAARSGKAESSSSRSKNRARTLGRGRVAKNHAHHSFALEADALGRGLGMLGQRSFHAWPRRSRSQIRTEILTAARKTRGSDRSRTLP